MDKEIDMRFDISDEETLFRLISSPGCISEEGELSPDIFSLYHKDEFYVSLIREIYQSLDDALPVGNKIKKWPFPEDTYWGLLKLNAKKIRDVSERIRLLSYYSDGNPSHAGISYVQDDGTFLIHTGDELIPEWLLPIQTMLCEIAEDVVKYEK